MFARLAHAAINTSVERPTTIIVNLAARSRESTAVAGPLSDVFRSAAGGAGPLASDASMRARSFDTSVSGRNRASPKTKDRSGVSVAYQDSLAIQASAPSGAC